MRLNINGKDIDLEVDPDTPLLWVLRDHLSMTGTKFGCGIAVCGACTVHIDGYPQRSCVYPAAAAEGTSITTIEGVNSGAAEAVRAAWTELQVPQCGYCQSGQIMSAITLIQDLDAPTDEDIDAAMAGNLCRCMTYDRIREAIKTAATSMPR
ncbi:(2Fe-2S)-binding protein [uncultured Roseobacter sp.]|uniref:(2Fe-2S)-binding protein n=1 Tax=uncultured Roseobacter sp. TaxID=114847 RepID=UPI0026178DA6|nr:(2Fe-2S)-binding protein [uncultured Roseobacter sp.]